MCKGLWTYTWLLFSLVVVQSFNPFTSTLAAFGSISLYAWNSLISIPSNLHCSVLECCSESSAWIPANITKLENLLKENVYGQHLVREIVVDAFRSHFRKHSHPKKALALSLHGWPGVGKNFVSKFIAESIYSEGFKSKYVHFFSPIIHFPLQSQADIYKMQLVDYIRGNVSLCERSLFIFDEVHNMHERILDGVKPFIDYHPSIGNVDYRKSMFIFLSNTGGNIIADQMMLLWNEGRLREQLTLKDFENLIKKGAFNEKGGFHKNQAIESNLIDHYVPFLPLEEQHVTRCIEDEIKTQRGTQGGVSNKYTKSNQVIIDNILSEITFSPEPSNKFSAAGCKRIAQKVARALSTDNSYHYEL